MTREENVQRPTSNAQRPTSETSFESTALGDSLFVETLDVDVSLFFHAK
jgi:hypothetical protein